MSFSQLPAVKKRHHFWSFLFRDGFKGQLMSKAIYGLVTSPKKRTNEFDLFAVKRKKAKKTNSSVRFLGEVSRPWIAFEINWPLAESKQYRQNQVAEFGRIRCKNWPSVTTCPLPLPDAQTVHRLWLMIEQPKLWQMHADQSMVVSSCDRGSSSSM